VLLAVGVHLPRLLQMPGGRGDLDSFLQKTASLVRMAVSAGAQKRNYLRRHDKGREQLTREFLLDRARLVVGARCLGAPRRAPAGEGIGSGKAGLEMAQTILSSLLANLRQAGLAANLDVCLDGLCGPHFESAAGFCLPGRPEQAEIFPSAAQVAGITPWDP